MCGIAGFIDTERSRDNAERLIDCMCQVIRHRGPDDQGIWVGDGLALGMRRLSIIDLAGGHQPVFNEDGTVAVVFNGEIYNFQKLRRELLSRGHFFRSSSDTEAIVHAYEEWGASCVDHLQGMFAFSVAETSIPSRPGQTRVMLARD